MGMCVGDIKKPQMDSRSRRYNFYLLPTSLPPGREKHEDQKVTKEEMILRKNYVICSILLSVLDHSLQCAQKASALLFLSQPEDFQHSYLVMPTISSNSYHGKFYPITLMHM